MTILRNCLLALSLSAAFAAEAAPVPSTAVQSPGILRRTALVVADMDLALRFYQGALGMVVVDDRTKHIPESATSDAAAAAVTRIVLLRSNDDYIGQLELIHYAKPLHSPLPPVADQDRHIGTVVMLFTVRDLAATFKLATALPGVRVIDAPHAYTYPAYGGKGMTTDIMATVRDPEGNWLELNQPTARPAG